MLVCVISLNLRAFGKQTMYDNPYISLVPITRIILNIITFIKICITVIIIKHLLYVSYS